MVMMFVYVWSLIGFPKFENQSILKTAPSSSIKDVRPFDRDQDSATTVHQEMRSGHGPLCCCFILYELPSTGFPLFPQLEKNNTLYVEHIEL
jgi:hypothetical protein